MSPKPQLKHRGPTSSPGRQRDRHVECGDSPYRPPVYKRGKASRTALIKVKEYTGFIWAKTFAVCQVGATAPAVSLHWDVVPLLVYYQPVPWGRAPTHRHPQTTPNKQTPRPGPSSKGIPSTTLYLTRDWTLKWKWNHFDEILVAGRRPEIRQLPVHPVEKKKIIKITTISVALGKGPPIWRLSRVVSTASQRERGMAVYVLHVQYWPKV